MKTLDLENNSISDKEIIETREKLGEIAKDMSDEELKEQIAAIKYLTETWLDEYERSIFDGKTLYEKLYHS